MNNYELHQTWVKMKEKQEMDEWFDKLEAGPTPAVRSSTPRDNGATHTEQAVIEKV